MYKAKNVRAEIFFCAVDLLFGRVLPVSPLWFPEGRLLILTWQKIVLFGFKKLLALPKYVLRKQ